VQLNEAGLEAIGELLQGDAVDQIVKYATIIEAGLIVLGHKHHDNWLELWWRSSIPKSFIEHSLSSVLVVIIKRICPTPKPPDVTILRRQDYKHPLPIK